MSISKSEVEIKPLFNLNDTKIIYSNKDCTSYFNLLQPM